MVAAPGTLNPGAGADLAPRHRGGRGRVGRAQHVVRHRHRRPDEAHRQPADPGGTAEARRCARHSASCSAPSPIATLGLASHWLAAGPACLHDLLLRRRLHDVAEALDRAEHRHRRRGRRAAAGDRLGGHDRQRLSGAAPLLPHHLHVDAAAFLGALAVDERRLRSAPASRCCPTSPARRRPGARFFYYSAVLAPLGALPWLLGFAGAALRAGGGASRSGVRPPRRSSCCAAATPTASAPPRAFSAIRSSIYSRFSRCGWSKRFRPGSSVSEDMGRAASSLRSRSRRRRRRSWRWPSCSACSRSSSTSWRWSRGLPSWIGRCEGAQGHVTALPAAAEGQPVARPDGDGQRRKHVEQTPVGRPGWMDGNGVGPPWLRRTRSTTTITSSIRARGRSSARFPLLFWRWRPFSPCTTPDQLVVGRARHRSACSTP